MTLRMRPALPADVPRMVAIERDAARLFGEVDGLEWLAGEEPDAQAYVTPIGAGTAWIAEANGEPAGFLVADRAGNWLHVVEVSVRRAVQGQGLGKGLLETASALAREQGLAGLTLTTFRDLAWNAPFYARLGFVMLHDDELDPHLREALEHDAAAGLPRARRCAMRLAFRRPQAGSKSPPPG